MKPFDLVGLKPEYKGHVYALWGGDEPPYGEGSKSTSIHFEYGNVAILLRVEKVDDRGYTDYFAKILTGNGSGWIYEHYLKAIR